MARPRTIRDGRRGKLEVSCKKSYRDALRSASREMDTVSRRERSRIMSLVRSANTKPEIAIRRMLHAMGYRYRLHRRDLPGNPDLVFPSRRKIVFVNGCFWHQHPCTRGSRIPASRRDYWVRKLRRNRKRDAVNLKTLMGMGWSPIVVWECQLKNPSRVARRLRVHLGDLGG